MLNIDNTYFDRMELQLNRANSSDTEASFLELHFTISDGFFSSNIYDKCDDIDFDIIVNFQFLDWDVPRATSYGGSIRHLSLFDLLHSSHVIDFNTRNKILTAKLLKHDYRYHKLRKTFLNSVDATMAWYQNLIRDSYLFLDKACRNLNFMVPLVYKFRKIVGRNDFSDQFKKIIIRYKRIEYNMNVNRQTACLVVHLITVNSCAALFNCTRSRLRQ